MDAVSNFLLRHPSLPMKMTALSTAPLPEQLKVRFPGLYVFKSAGACMGKSELVRRMCERCHLRLLRLPLSGAISDQLLNERLAALRPQPGDLLLVQLYNLTHLEEFDERLFRLLFFGLSGYRDSFFLLHPKVKVILELQGPQCEQLVSVRMLRASTLALQAATEKEFLVPESHEFHLVMKHLQLLDLNRLNVEEVLIEGWQ